MDFWQRARSFAEEAAKKSQELTQNIASKSQELSQNIASKSQELSQNIASTNLSDVVSEASKRSKELAEKSKELAAEALKRADRLTAQIKSNTAVESPVDVDLEKYGVTDDLREFVKGITPNTFQDFPLEDDSDMSDIPTVSNVRQDLTEWQEKHAKLVLLTVMEISKLRYQLCPKLMKERKFWRIYFILVNSHVAPYERCYMEEIKLKSEEKVNDAAELKEDSSSHTSSKTASNIPKQKSNSVKSAASEQDLDVFLLGDLEDDDDGPDDGDGEGFDDDFDKI